MDMQASGGQIHSIGAQVGGMGIYNRTAGVYAMFINDSSNTGFGTTSPTEKLHVGGRVRIATIDNGTGDFATISGTGVITRRTAAQVLSDVGAQPSGSYLTAEADTLATVTGRGASTSTAVTFSGGATISNLLINGASAYTEGSLALGAMGTSEGGQLVLNKATSHTYAAHIDVWQDSLRFLYGTNTATSGVAMGINMATGRVNLPFYTSSSSFTGTATGVLAFDSSGNILTIAVPSGAVSSVNAGTGVSVNSTTGAVTVSIGQSVATSASPTFNQIITTNNGGSNNVKLGDDAWIGDTNVSNTVGIVGQQNSDRAYISFGSDNTVTLGRIGTGPLTWGSNNVWHAGNDGSGSGLDADLLDGNHASAFYLASNPSGYISSYTETDTLATVTARGSSTNGSIFINGVFTGGLGAVTTSGTLDWNDVSNARAGQGYTLLLGTATNGMGGGQYYHPVSFEYSSKNGSGNMTQLAIPYTGNGIWYRNRYGGSWSSWARVWDDSSFTSTNISNWNTAYGWGNHGSQGYATQTYVNTAIANLVDSAPSTLDTLNELAAALGDDPNFATTVTNSIAAKLPLAGGTMTGTIYFSNDMGTALQGTIGDNDFWRIRGGNSGSNAGFLEIATSDDGTEPIYVRQYTGVFSSLTRTATLLDGSGNTSLPGSLTVGGTITENSSIRYKENVVNLESATEKVEQLRAVRYNKIGHELEEIGLIAEEVAEVYPEVVNYNEEGQPDGVNYTRLSVILLKAVQELTERINKLESK